MTAFNGRDQTRTQQIRRRGGAVVSVEGEFPVSVPNSQSNGPYAGLDTHPLEELLILVLTRSPIPGLKAC